MNVSNLIYNSGVFVQKRNWNVIFFRELVFQGCTWDGKLQSISNMKLHFPKNHSQRLLTVIVMSGFCVVVIKNSADVTYIFVNWDNKCTTSKLVEFKWFNTKMLSPLLTKTTLRGNMNSLLSYKSMYTS